MPSLLKCIAKAAVKHGPKALAQVVPFGDVLYELAAGVWQEYQDDRKAAAQQQYQDDRKAAAQQQPRVEPDAALRAEVQVLAQASPAEVRQAAVQAVLEAAANQPAQVQQTLTTYLTQVPAMIHRSLRRPADPTGTTVPPTLSLRQPADLLPFLPPKLPRFQPGDRPLPGVDWQLEELLGVGGFGEVWKARHAQLKGLPPVALKFCLDTTTAEALRHEAEVLDQVMQQGRHPGIVPLRNAYLNANPPCLEYEYVAGGDLAGLIQELRIKGGPPPLTAARIVHNLAQTVGFAHRLPRPIVHRDLKPANILVQRGPDRRLALRIADFGIGALAATDIIRRETSRPNATGRTLPTAIRGASTPLYASPQQTLGQPADPRDDVHALGVIWYQLLVGDLTKGVPTGLAWTKKLASGGVPVGMVDLLAECIEDDPEGRPRDAQVLAERLNALLNPTLTPTPTPTPAPAQQKAGDVSTNSLGMRFAFVPRGSFWMGGGAGTPGDEEVAIKHDFRIGAFPVTQGQWQAMMGNNPSHFSRTGDGKDEVKDVSDAELKDFPVERVSWDDVQEFLRKLNEREQNSGFVHRLPSEAEWEYACRGAVLSPGGTMSKEECSFDFYIQPQPTNSLSSRQANFNGKYPCGGAGKGPYLGRTCKVGSYQPNRLGIYDLHGNVWEWCQDTDDGGETRTFRGGGCYDGAKDCRAATRDGGEPEWSGGHVGFRVVAVAVRAP